MAFSDYSTVFDGANEYADCGDVLDFEYTTPFSVSLWVKTTAGDERCLLAKSGDGPTYPGWGVLVYNGGYLEFYISDSTQNWPSGSFTAYVGKINDNKWHHCVATWDGSNTQTGLKLYIDGIPYGSYTWRATSPLASTSTNSAALRLASRATAGVPQYLPGYLDEISVYDKVLSEAEVTELFDSVARVPKDLSTTSTYGNILAWWRMGDGDTYPTLQDVKYLPPPAYPLLPDESVSGNDGTLTNMETSDVQTVYPFGKAMDFDGSNDYVTPGNVLGFDRGNTRSFSFWAYYRTNGNGSSAITKTAAGGEFIIVFDSTTNRQYFGIGTTWPTNWLSRLGVPPSSMVNRWTHVVITYDGSSDVSGVKMYFDGVEASSYVTDYNTLSSGSILNSAQLKIGYKDLTYQPMNGQLAHMAIWDKVLSLAEVQEVYDSGAMDNDLTTVSCAANLMAWWPLGARDVYPTATDRSGNGYHGTMTNMDAGDIVDRTPVVSNPGRSLAFDGVNEYVSMGDVLSFERTDSFSFSCWFKTTSTTDAQIISRFNSTPGINFQMTYGTEGRVGLYLVNTWPTNRITVVSTAGWNDGKWHLAVATYDGSSTAAGVTVYIDGEDRTSIVEADTLSATIVNAVAELEIASRNLGTSQFFTGSVADAAVWDKELSAAEVEEAYNQGVPTDLTGHSASANLVGYWLTGQGVSLPYPATMTNMEAGDIQTDIPALPAVTTADATLLPSDAYSDQLDGKEASVLQYGSTEVTAKGYRLRAFKQSDGSPVFWTSFFYPASNPFGFSVRDTTIIGVLELEREV